jgi:hypothetical protein
MLKRFDGPGLKLMNSVRRLALPPVSMLIGTGIGAGCTAFGDTYAGMLLHDAGDSIVVGRFTLGEGVLGQLDDGFIGLGGRSRLPNEPSFTLLRIETSVAFPHSITSLAGDDAQLGCPPLFFFPRELLLFWLRRSSRSSAS